MGQVDFYFDGAYVGTDITNSAGYACLRIADSSAWHVGAHAIRAQFERYPRGAATDLAVLTVGAETTELVAREGYLEARVTDDDANPRSRARSCASRTWAPQASRTSATRARMPTASRAAFPRTASA